MSSFWPFRRDTTSPASFERALSKLSTRITAQTASLDRSRSTSRRIRALFTLYTTLAYLVYTLILAFVLGYRRWNIGHYAGLLGAPAVIYAVRRTMEGAWGWRINRLEKGLDDLVRQREETIKQLKEATKYNSTQELIKKYGGDTPREKKPGPTQQGTKRKVATPQQSTPGGGMRTGIPPPPTANIPGRNILSSSPPNAPQDPLSSTPQPQRQPLVSPSSPAPSETESFAPNAFSYPPPSIPSSQQSYAPPPTGSHWYDRLLDILLGEDETLAKNRLALICSNCRLVNGQAPPGARTVLEVGRWKCGGCGALNGMDEDERIGATENVVLDARRVDAARERIEAGAEEKEREEEEEGGRDREALRERMRRRSERERGAATTTTTSTSTTTPSTKPKNEGKLEEIGDTEEDDEDEDEDGGTPDLKDETLDEMHGEAAAEDSDDDEGGEEEGEEGEREGAEVTKSRKVNRKPVTRSVAKEKEKKKGKKKGRNGQ